MLLVLIHVARGGVIDRAIRLRCCTAAIASKVLSVQQLLIASLVLLVVLLDSILIDLLGSKEEGIRLVVKDSHFGGRHYEFVDELVDGVASVDFVIKMEASCLAD